MLLSELNLTWGQICRSRLPVVTTLSKRWLTTIATEIGGAATEPLLAAAVAGRAPVVALRVRAARSICANESAQ